ncbi:uncharacterized protein BDV14DRAFT_167051 [Aspergillus stella-maris]|uniref:uncharacterized protein n=1 Tax=Aspergillus stella-maris TaxID=1810926 RepID=UPI003CCDA2F2
MRILGLRGPMLVVDLLVPGPVGSGSGSGSDADGYSTVERTVVLGLAIPSAWGNGSAKSLRLRGCRNRGQKLTISLESNQSRRERNFV